MHTSINLHILTYVGQLESSELSLYAERRDNPAGAAVAMGLEVPFVVAVEVAATADGAVAVRAAVATAGPVFVVEAATVVVRALGLTSTNGVFRFTKGCEVAAVLLTTDAMLGLVNLGGGGIDCFASSSLTSSIISSLTIRLVPSALFLKFTDLKGIVGL